MRHLGSFREWVVNLSLACGSVLILALIAELLLTFLVPLLYRPRITRLDDVVGWYHASSVRGVDDMEGHRYNISYNWHGYRGPDRPYEKPQGIRRVVVLGDSFTDGSEVGDEELFTWKLERALNGVEVINLGVYGYQTAQEFVTLQDRGLRYSPDAVVLVVVPNDLPGNVVALESFGPAPRFVLAGDSIVLEDLDHPSAREAFRVANLPAPRWIYRNSTLYYLINTHIYHRLVAEHIGRFRQARLAEVSLDDQAELFRRIVLRMRDLCSKHGIPLLVVFTHQRNDVLTNETSRFAAIAEALERDGVMTIDLFERFRRQEQDGPTPYYRNDPHWNVIGHDKVAEWLTEPVRDLLAH
jgi:hypothetical protein